MMKVLLVSTTPGVIDGIATKSAEWLRHKGAERTSKENDALLSIAAYHVPNELCEIPNFLRNIGYEVFIRRLGESRAPYVYASRR
jgi:hypothetical protein